MDTMFSFIKKIKKSLFSISLGKRLKSLFAKPLDNETVEEIEELLYEADMGSTCVNLYINRINKYYKLHPKASASDLISEMKVLTKSILEQKPRTISPPLDSKTPHLHLILGVNGSGKTTTCAKLSKRLKDKGNKVLLAACDTYRAAAVSQLKKWSDRVGVDLMSTENSKIRPSSLFFDAIDKAQNEGYDYVLCDTAGRLENKESLMEEIKKIYSIGKRKHPQGSITTYMVLDGTIGQNALEQVKSFDTYTPIDKIIITKLDGSAKGGALIPIYNEFKIPIEYIGIGEQEEDLIPFNLNDYIEALFQT